MGLLLSAYFQGDTCFQACLDDDERIAEGDLGAHVVVIQYAVLALCGGQIAEAEMRYGYFGPTTAQAVFGYNLTRQIQGSVAGGGPADYVAGATLAQMDREMAWLT